MKYSIYQLDFYNGVRFGKGRLETTEMTFHADTLFAALFQEAIKLGKEKIFLDAVRNGALRWSDAFPYKGRQLFLPKPMFQPPVKETQEQGNSIRKKQFKNMKYVPIEYIKAYMKGEYPEKHLEDCKKIGKEGVKTAVAVRGHEESEPYRVSAYYFNAGNGLYLILGSSGEAAEILFDDLMESLSYSGLGGKKSAGLGRFEYVKKTVPDMLGKALRSGSEGASGHFGQSASGEYAVLMSTALPEEEKLKDVLTDASYSLLKRIGFVDSTTFDDQQMRKKDLYVLAAGSCMKNVFDGCMVEEKNGGRHPVYRYAYGLFLEVNV